MSNVAQRIISKFPGGESEIAELLNCDVSRVYRWTYPKERGGTGGTIPQKRQHELMEKALLKGIELSPSDFFDLPAPALSTQERAAS